MEKQSADERMLAEHTKQREDIEADFADKITLATNHIELLKDEKT